MVGKKTIACVIPARLQSSRFPRKMLSYIRGKPLLQWVWEAAVATGFFDSVTFAVDDAEIAHLIEKFGGKFYFTSVSCASGTERLIELLLKKKIDADIWVNWQGDEPFIQKEVVAHLLRSCHTEDSDVWTLKKRIYGSEEIVDPSITKVVCDAKGFALYFSRASIPYYRESALEKEKIIYKHIGMYAFTQKALKKIATFSSCYLEEAEKLEQLRFLYHGLRIRVEETDKEIFGIDLPEHLSRAETYAKEHFS